VIWLAVELAELCTEVRADGLHDLLHAFQVLHGEHLMPVLGDENQVNVQDEYTVSTSADIPVISHETKYAVYVQLRYNYRLDPAPRHRKAFARAFGCARVVVNDALRARQEARQAGLPYITDAELSARLSAAKKTPERAWLNAVSAVVLQQALADLNTAYRNFFASVTGKRKGPEVARPGSGPARTIGRPSGSPPTPGSRYCPMASCGCPRSATCRCGGLGRCHPSRPRSR